MSNATYSADDYNDAAPVRYLRVLMQADQLTITKRLLAKGTDEQVLNALNTAYPNVHFTQVIDSAAMETGEIVRFID